MGEVVFAHEEVVDVVAEFFVPGAVVLLLFPAAGCFSSLLFLPGGGSELVESVGAGAQGAGEGVTVGYADAAPLVELLGVPSLPLLPGATRQAGPLSGLLVEDAGGRAELVGQESRSGAVEGHVVADGVEARIRAKMGNLHRRARRNVDP